MPHGKKTPTNQQTKIITYCLEDVLFLDQQGGQGGQMMGLETSVSSPTMELFVVNQTGGTLGAKNCV